jgi:hypothetical protein
MFLGLNPQQWFWIMLCAVLVGLAKTGLSAAGMLAVPLMADAVGGRASVGLLLLILCVGDLLGVKYYHTHARWAYVVRALPWAVVGIGVGLLVGARVSEPQFDLLLGAIVLASLGLVFWRELRGPKRVPVPGKVLGSLVGVGAGFTTMVGNAAGSLMMLYLLSMRLPKYAFIGTIAWFFMLVNLIKVPAHVLVWETIDLTTVKVALITTPLVVGGALVGVRVVRLLSERAYRMLILLSTVAAALKFIF